ncbi:MAG: T9SS type A sorting domain-containing protein [Bacteroidota bacterium]
MKSTLVICAVLLSLSALGQSNKPKVTYSYDAQGNRIQRTLIYPIIKKDPDVLNVPVGQDSLMVLGINPDPEEGRQQLTDVFHDRVGKQEVAIYPNPTMGRLTIGLKNIDNVSSCSLEIVDMSGKAVFSSTSVQQVFQFDMVAYPAGSYTVNIAVNGVRSQYTVVKQ